MFFLEVLFMFEILDSCQTYIAFHFVDALESHLLWCTVQYKGRNPYWFNFINTNRRWSVHLYTLRSTCIRKYFCSKSFNFLFVRNQSVTVILLKFPLPNFPDMTWHDTYTLPHGRLQSWKHYLCYQVSIARIMTVQPPIFQSGIQHKLFFLLESIMKCQCLFHATQLCFKYTYNVIT